MTLRYAHPPKLTTRLPVRYILLALLLIAELSYGAWDTIPDIRLLTETDDNPRLRPEGQENDASRVLLDARLAVVNYGNRGSFYIQPRIRASAYSDTDDEDLEDEELFLRTYGHYDWQAATIGYSAFMSQQNIRNAEFRSSEPVDPDVPDPDDPGTGLGVFVDGEREALWATPYIEFHLSDRNSMLFELRHTEVFYTGLASFNRSDYDQNEFSFGLVRRVGEITEVTARVFASEFQSEINNNVTDTVGVEGEFVQPLGATWTMNVIAGVQRNDFSYEADDEVLENADTNLTLTFGFRKRADRTRLNFDIGRAIYPSGAGFVSEVSQVRFWAQRSFTQRLSGSFGARYERSKTLDQVSTVRDRDYYRFDLNIDWALTPRWFLTAGYRLTDQEFDNIPNSKAQSNSIFFGVSFRGLSQQ